MSEASVDSPASLLRWRGDALEPIDSCEIAEIAVVAADSWFVRDGRVLAIGLHRERFMNSVPSQHRAEAETFWDAALGAIPREGEWFPRVDLVTVGGRPEFRLRVRPSPERKRSVRVATHRGSDPRTTPRIKGPDLVSMLRLRTEAQAQGAEEAILVSPEGYIIEGAYSAVVWWRGDILCTPADDLERVDSVTARSLQTLAVALGVEVVQEHTTANELDGLEVWTLNALHGIRIVTAWVDGPSVAELPGRLDLWRRRLSALRRPVA